MLGWLDVRSVPLTKVDCTQYVEIILDSELTKLPTKLILLPTSTLPVPYTRTAEILPAFKLASKSPRKPWMLPIKLPITLLLAIRFAARILPELVSPVNVPTLVTNGCAFVSKLPDTLPAVTTAALNELTPRRPAISTLPPMAVLPAIHAVPSTLNEVKLPTVLILGCAEVCNVPDNATALTVPVVFRLAAVALPLTVRPVSVPTVVMFGCRPVARRPVRLLANTLDACTLPVTATLESPVIFPVTSRSTRVPTWVIFVWLAVTKVPCTLVNVPLVPLMLPTVTFPVTSRSTSVPTSVMLVCAGVWMVP